MFTNVENWLGANQMIGIAGFGAAGALAGHLWKKDIKWTIGLGVAAAALGWWLSTQATPVVVAAPATSGN